MVFEYDRFGFLIKISNLPQSIYDTTLKKLDLSNLNLKKLNFDKIFKGKDSRGNPILLYSDVEILILSNNNINNLNNIKCTQYDILPNLKEIHLDNNYILFLDIHLNHILHFRNLEVLNLSNNLIMNISNNMYSYIEHLPNFRLLNLNNNLIINTTLSTLYYKDIPKKTKKSDFSIYNDFLSNNNLLRYSPNITIDLRNNYLYELPVLNVEAIFNNYINSFSANIQVKSKNNVNGKNLFMTNINKITNGYNKFLNKINDQQNIYKDDIRSKTLLNIIDEIYRKEDKSIKESYFLFIMNSLKILYNKNLSNYNIYMNLLLSTNIEYDYNSLLGPNIGTIENILFYKNIFDKIITKVKDNQINVNDYFKELYKINDFYLKINYLNHIYQDYNYKLYNDSLLNYVYILPNIYSENYASNYYCNPNIILPYEVMIRLFNNNIDEINIIKTYYYKILFYMNDVVRKYYNGIEKRDRYEVSLNNSLNLFLLLLNNIYDTEINDLNLYDYRKDKYYYDFSYIKYKLRMYLEEDNNYMYYLYFYQSQMFKLYKNIYIDKLFVLIKKICIDIYIHKNENPIFIEYLSKLNLLEPIKSHRLQNDNEYNIDRRWITFDNSIQEYINQLENVGSTPGASSVPIISGIRKRRYKLNMSHMNNQNIDFCLDIYMSFIDTTFKLSGENTLLNKILHYFPNNNHNSLYIRSKLNEYMDSIYVNSGHAGEIPNKLVIIPENKELYFISPYRVNVSNDLPSNNRIDTKYEILHKNRSVYTRGFYYENYDKKYSSLQNMKHYKSGMLTLSYMINSISDYKNPNDTEFRRWRFCGIKPLYNLFKNINQIDLNIKRDVLDDTKPLYNPFIKSIFMNKYNNFFLYQNFMKKKFDLLPVEKYYINGNKSKGLREDVRKNIKYNNDYIDFLFKILFSQCDKEVYKTYEQKYKYLQKNKNMSLNYMLNSNKDKKCRFIIHSCRSIDIKLNAERLKNQLKVILKKIIKLHKIIEKKKQIINQIVIHRPNGSINFSKLVTESSTLQSKVLNQSASLSTSFIKQKYGINNYNLYQIRRDIYNILNVYNRLMEGYKHVDNQYIININNGLQNMNKLFKNGEMNYNDVENTIDNLLFINRIFAHKRDLVRLEVNEMKPIIRNPFKNILKIASTNELNRGKITKNKNRVLKRSYSMPTRIDKINLINILDQNINIHNELNMAGVVAPASPGVLSVSPGVPSVSPGASPGASAVSPGVPRASPAASASSSSSW